MTKVILTTTALCLIVTSLADARTRHHYRHARMPASVTKEIASTLVELKKLRLQTQRELKAATTAAADIKRELASLQVNRWMGDWLQRNDGRPLSPSLTIAVSFASLNIPDVRGFPDDPPQRITPNDVDDYLFSVYERTATKVDSAGDFTWKDPAAAKRIGKTLQEYVIGGMNRDFRESLYHAGKAMDAAGIRWTILSAFRDNYRQKIAVGFKASGGNSRHGGDRATKGYGDGQAIDLAGSGVFAWMDRNGRKYGLYRPMPGHDPNHIQAGGDWHRIAANLRDRRDTIQLASADGVVTLPVNDVEAPRVAERSRVRKVKHYRHRIKHHRRHHARA